MQTLPLFPGTYIYTRVPKSLESLVNVLCKQFNNANAKKVSWKTIEV